MMMDGDDLADALYARMRWNTPLSSRHADLLMDRLDLRAGLRIADVGCGWGELLLRMVSRLAGPDAVGGAAGQVSGTGVDTDSAGPRLRCRP
jgi:ubiquinone/menaquinone biosynthesis C-methylase UbiE